MYSNVQYAGDENVRRVQRWSIETVQLPQTCVVIDQNQTSRASNEDCQTDAPEPNTIVGGKITGWNIDR